MSEAVNRETDARRQRRKRAYDNRGRAARARATRQRIIDAARELFVCVGYPRTTLGQIAARAEVSVESVQKVFGTKGQLARTVYDVTLVGDDEQVPLFERPQARAMAAESDPARIVARFAVIGGSLWQRLGPLYRTVLSGAATGDADLVDLLEAIRADGAHGARMVVGLLAARNALAPGMSVERAEELLWWLIQPEQYHLLVDVLGWSPDRVAQWFTATAGTLLLGHAVEPLAGDPDAPG